MWPPRSVPSQSAADGRTILFVENDAAVRDIVETMLAEARYRVLAATDGIAAFRLLERHPEITLLFTDIKMPKIDGLMLADMAKLRRPAIKVLYATAFGAEVERQPGYRYGEILAKPFRPVELLAAVQRAIASPSTPSKPRARPAA